MILSVLFKRFRRELVSFGHKPGQEPRWELTGAHCGPVTDRPANRRLQKEHIRPAAVASPRKGTVGRSTIKKGHAGQSWHKHKIYSTLIYET